MSDGEQQAASPDLRELYLRYGGCVGYIVVRKKNGDESIGSAFHVGEGVLVTARHVLEGNDILEVQLPNTRLYYRSDLYPRETTGAYSVGPDSVRMIEDWERGIDIEGPPVFHPNPLVDVAAIRVTGLTKGAHYVPLGSHLDDWVGDGDFPMSEVLVLGYPPIPFTTGPHLIAMKGEVAATVDLRVESGTQMHFIVSTMARGGFSGGLVFSGWGFALGLVTNSLVRDGKAEETGYMAVVSVEAIYECLARNEMLPLVQKEMWDGLWDD